MPRDAGDWNTSFGKGQGQALPGINLGKPAGKITTNAGYVSSFMGSAKKQSSKCIIPLWSPRMKF